MSHTFATLLSSIIFNFRSSISHIKPTTQRVNIRQAATLCLVALCLCAGLILSTHVAANSSATQQRGKARPAVVREAFVVTKIADTNDGACDSDCSLREAIVAANASTGMSTITFALPADSTITLANGELVINSNLTIDGTNTPRLIVDAHIASRVFSVNAGVVVSIANLTATNGRVNQLANSGGACILNAGTLTLTNLTVSNGFVYYSDGGGILNTGTLTLTNSTVSNCSGIDHRGGGGIFNSGTLAVINSTFAGNKVFNSNNDGGAILNDDNGTTSVTNSIFTGGYAPSKGGGIANLSGTLTVSGSTFDNNSATSTGGAIYSSGTSSLSNSVLSNNFSRQNDGGGIYVGSGTMSVTGTIIRNSSADNEGGGIKNLGTITVSNSIISDNQSAYAGSGIANQGTCTLTDSTVSGNYGGGGNGSAIANDGTLTVMRSTFNNNSGFWGAIRNSGTAGISNSTITNNVAGSDGGAITNRGVTFDITSSTISHNSGGGGSGFGNGNGGIKNYGAANNITISNTIIANNSASNSPDVRGAFTSQGHNLIGIVDGSTGFGASGDQVGTTANPLDPLLGPLQNNGAFTQTRALLPGSPAIDTGATTLPTDQRGVPRPQGPNNDIGAFELQSNIPASFVAVSGIVSFEGHGLAGVTVTLSGDASATTTTDANGFYSFTNLTGGTYFVTASRPNFTFTPSTRVVISNGRNQAADFVANSTLNNPQLANGRLLISEFRLRGPIPTSTPVASGNEGGQLDEFIELYNNTDAPQNITGYRIDTSAGFSIALPNGAIMPARGHFLLVNAGYSLNAYATSDLSYQGFDLEPTDGLAVLDSSSNVLDAVGLTGSPTSYREGAGLTQAITSPGEYSFVRRLASGQPQDTGNNSADFILVSTTGGNFGTPTVLGAPGPENFSSPIVKNNPQFPGNYIDPMTCGSCLPNRVIVGTSPRILKIRRTYTNLTGGDITRLRFRIIDLTTLGNQANGEADLRVISSSAEVINLLSGTTPTANALTREEPPNQTASGQDGGLNTTVADNTITLAAPLASNAKVSVNYWLRIVAGGRFRFFVNIEALP